MEIRTRIMDNSTYMPIAWTNLYVEGNLKCISNIDGDILTKADEGESHLLHSSEEERCQAVDAADGLGSHSAYRYAHVHRRKVVPSVAIRRERGCAAVCQEAGGDITILERMPGDLKIHVSFREKNGFTEVSDMYYEIAANDVSIQSVLFNVEDYHFPFKRPVPVRDNLLEAIHQMQASPQLFETPNVIKRTEKEDAIIRGSR